MARQKKRGDGRYSKGFRENGKYYNVTARTPEELERKVAAKREEISKGVERRINPTFAEFSADWMERRSESVKAASIRSQSVWLNTICGVKIPNINKAFGELRIKEILAADCIALQSEIHTNHSSRTTNDYIALTRQILEDARKQRVIDYNPTDVLKQIKRTEPAARQTIHRALDDSEVERFREIFADSYYMPLVDFLLASGMRLGEACAIRLCDLKSDRIDVLVTITRTRNGLERGEDGKTEAATRSIPMNNELKAIISRQKEILKMMGLIGDVVSLDSLLFPGQRGGFLSPNVVDRAIKAACVKADIEPFTSHSCRATFISRGLSSGISPKVLADLVGHDDLSMTLNLYGHSFEQDKKSAMQKMMDDWSMRKEA